MDELRGRVSRQLALRKFRHHLDRDGAHRPMGRRRKSKSPAKSRPKSRRGFRINLAWIKPPDWHVARQSVIGLSWVICAGVIVAAWIVGIPRLQAFASTRQYVEPHAVTIRFVNAPAWLRGDLADTLLRTATMQVGGNPLVRDDLVAVRESLIGTGWFDSIAQVRRVRPDVVEIRAAFVKPYALIRDQRADHLVDPAGKLLPKQYKHGDSTNFIVINGAHFDRPSTGNQWEGTDVAAGLKLVAMICSQPWKHQVAEIDVSEFLNDGPITLRTDSGTTIVWGFPPGEEAALELPADGKLQRLNYLFTHHGRIDGNRTGELDITVEKAVFVR